MALICNLVQEFNGLVSKGSTAMLAFLLFEKSTVFTPRSSRPFRSFPFKKQPLKNFYRFILSHTVNAVLFLR